jgi:hypothetical protein
VAPVLLAVDVADPAGAWAAAGFATDGAAAVVGGVCLRFVPGDGGRGIVGWSLGGVPAGSVVDGLPVGDPPLPLPARAHPNGVTGLDHLVLRSPDGDRTLAALARIGVEPRRTRDVTLGGIPHRQTFLKLGDPILELVGPVEPGPGPSVLWGLAFLVDDLDATASVLGSRLGTVRPAVQPGRRIASLRKADSEVSVPVAFLDRRGGDRSVTALNADR